MLMMMPAPKVSRYISSAVSGTRQDQLYFSRYHYVLTHCYIVMLIASKFGNLTCLLGNPCRLPEAFEVIIYVGNGVPLII
jgi:hypothetical protein